jgi:hypothetical protein
VKITTISDPMPIIAHGGVEIHSHLLVFERKKTINSKYTYSDHAKKKKQEEEEKGGYPTLMPGTKASSLEQTCTLHFEQYVQGLHLVPGYPRNKTRTHGRGSEEVFIIRRL